MHLPHARIHPPLVLPGGYGLSLEGAGRAMSFLFTPDWAALGKPETYLAAIGQAFFSSAWGWAY
jgi:neurotransmitter:Na+ symporter, NSS family